MRRKSVHGLLFPPPSLSLAWPCAEVCAGDVLRSRRVTRGRSRQLDSLRLAGGGGGKAALTDAEREQIVAAARTEAGVVGDGGQGTRYFEEPYELRMGRPRDAAWGLEDRMKVDSAAFHARVAKGADGIEEEAAEFAAKGGDGAELLELVDYVVNQRTSEKEYPNGIRDQGRGGVRPAHFTTHASAHGAKLGEAEVYALRLYTTQAYRHMNAPLRDDDRYAKEKPVPLPVASHWAASAIRKLRAVRAESMPQEEEGAAAVVVWRGMRSRRVAEGFMRRGGTELGFMSTTTDLAVAVRYSLSRHSLLLRIVASSFMSLGADLRWVSAFPGEAEVLFPPLTYLQPTGRTDRVDAVDRDGSPVSFTVIEVTPYIG
jgi:hypothetical protein